jgi:uncharacterized protein (TIGR02145 family)
MELQQQNRLLSNNSHSKDMTDYNRPFVFLILVSLMVVLMLSGCKDKDETNPGFETSTVTDNDGNVYRTIKIGDQWWMAENLKSKTFRNGDVIFKKQNNQDWQEDGPAYCLFNELDNAPGYLYNYAAVTSSKGLAPAGWRIPTDEDWKLLEKNLGMSEGQAQKSGWRGTTEGDMLKVKAPEGWIVYGQIWGTDKVGFSGLAGACRLPDGRWADPGLQATAFWWTATTDNQDKAYYRYLDYKSSAIFRSATSVRYGMSVRCVKE